MQSPQCSVTPPQSCVVRFPESYGMRLRRELRACRGVLDLAKFAWRIVRQAERTAQGKRCPFCQLHEAQTPAAGLVVAAKD